MCSWASVLKSKNPFIRIREIIKYLISRCTYKSNLVYDFWYTEWKKNNNLTCSVPVLERLHYMHYCSVCCKTVLTNSVIIVNGWIDIIVLSGTKICTLIQCQIQCTVKHMIGWYRKVLINVYLLYAVKHEMQENNHLKQTITKSLLAYAAKNGIWQKIRIRRHWYIWLKYGNKYNVHTW